MAAVPSRQITSAAVDSLKFSFYTDEEINKISVKKLFSPLTLDNLKHPISGGLYDPSLGPLEIFDVCQTCGLKYRACPGHFGHIELALPVYNPLVFGTLYKLLRCLCLHCYSFRLSEKEQELCLKKLKLLLHGNLVEACQIQVGSGSQLAPVDVNGLEETELQFHGRSISVEDEEEDAKLCTDSPIQTSLIVEAMRNFQTEFFRHITTGACPKCNAFSPAIKRDGCARLFLKPLDSKKASHNELNGIKIVSALKNVIGQHFSRNQQITTVGQEYNSNSRLHYITPVEVFEIMKRFWANDFNILHNLYTSDDMPTLLQQNKIYNKPVSALNGYRVFFVKTIFVPPNNVRPMSRLGDLAFEHPQNTALAQIINYNLELVNTSKKDFDVAETDEVGPLNSLNIEQSLQTWLNLQNSVNGLFDSSAAEGSAGNGQGIRQLLEKKEGLFRKNMMGKRVNFACRSVISPDPYLSSGEIGVPPYFAVRLSIPERVTPFNIQVLREMVVRGAQEHPGANAVEDEHGRLVSLSQLSKPRREALAKQLLSQQGSEATSSIGRSTSKIVYRHLKDGDIMLSNRQPTLHKPGLMAHRACILKGERTIRMHYANCASFNADFDGDEINLHVPQDLLAQAEGYNIVHADYQYIVPTDGKPVRGLIQDHVVAGVQLTKRDSFYNRSDFTQLLYSALCPTRPGLLDFQAFSIPKPAILKPQKLWTGKQVISAILQHLTTGKESITFNSKCKTSEKFWGKCNSEEVFTVFRNELMTGVMDKAQYGKFGLVHAVQELYGSITAGTLLSVLSRLWTSFLQMNGFTCGIGDLLLTELSEKKRVEIVAQAEKAAWSASAELVGFKLQDNESLDEEKTAKIQHLLGEKYCTNKLFGTAHDRRATSSLQPLSSQIVDVCLPNGQKKLFPTNCLSMMTVTGAKGSQVNFSQISCLLGQQELEGRRVPRMASGKTLPCYVAYEGGARSGGYISDRFVSGLRPQEYFFHCMAGREGLVDTTVKTSRSGYLQRCLLKNLECLCVHYDGTVRDSADGSVVQFKYGEDGIDVTNSSYLQEFSFLEDNLQRLKEIDDVGCAAVAAPSTTSPLDMAKLLSYKRMKRQMQGKKIKGKDNVVPISALFGNATLGCTSELYMDSLNSYLIEKHELHRGRKRDMDGKQVKHWRRNFTNLMDTRYARLSVAPGEAVGVIAAQSVGEPSTQMTLNTFHMAGRGEANVTLGIPRLRELLMTASKTIKTPVMVLPLLPGKLIDEAGSLLNSLRKIRLAEVVEDLQVFETFVSISGCALARQYKVQLKLYDSLHLLNDSKLNFEMISGCFTTIFLKKLLASIKKQLGAFKKHTILSETMPLANPKLPNSSEEKSGDEFLNTKLPDGDEEDENMELNDDFIEGKIQFSGKSERMVYTADDDDKRSLMDQLKEVELRDNLQEDLDNDVVPVENSTTVKEISGTDCMIKSENLDCSNNICSATVSIPLSAPKILMLELVEKLAAETLIQSTTGIDKCYVVEGKDNPEIQTDGINYEKVWCMDDLVDINRLSTNDVGSILSTYGVEAARATLVREVGSVFGAYGIAVDPRHLSLIADFMTHQGGYRACNRLGIENSTSPLLKMSFETASQFLTDATLKGSIDDLRSPASRIIVGRTVDLGTGMFDLRHHLVEA